jgi:imidazolonepropionase
MRFDTIWLDARLGTLAPGGPGLGIVERGAVAAKDGRIAFVGPMAELPTGWDAFHRVALDGRWVTPGLVDCHTHLVYAGTGRASSSCAFLVPHIKRSHRQAAASSRR